MTRVERRAQNRAAHAARRAACNEDYRQARADGLATTWREIWDVYAAIESAAAIELLAPVVKAAPKPKRRAPAHIAAVAADYRAARDAWEEGLEAALGGARRSGKPARGEDARYCDEERDYRAAHPAPAYREYLADHYANARAGADMAVSA